MRPQFTVFVAVPAARALELIRTHLREAAQTEAPQLRGWITPPFAELRASNEAERIWMPRLSVYAEDTAGGAHLMCRLGPKPDLWTLYVAIAAALCILALVFGGLAFSQWSLGQPWRWSGLAVALAIFALAGLYTSVFVGQRLGAEDMRALHAELMRALAADADAMPVHVESLPPDLRGSKRATP